MSIEAMKQAFDAIETYSPEYMHGLPKKHYTKLLLKAIEEAEKREWVGLTDEEVDAVRDETVGLSPLIRAVEAKLKEKNARLQQRHEWVGLTKEEMFELFEKYSDRPFSLMIATHDKVKEKNT